LDARSLGSSTTNGVYVGALDSNDTSRLIEGDAAAIFVRSGHLLFVRQTTLFAQPFEPDALRFVGDAVRIAESLPFEGTAAPPFSVSESGTLTHRTGLGSGDQQFAWFDRSGRLLETVGAPGQYRGVDLSPDGTRIAVHRHDANGGDVWVFEPRGTMTRLTFDPTYDNSMPIWSPDGNSIVFGSQRNGRWGIYRKPSNGSGNEVLLVESEGVKTPMDWTPDGASILYWTDGTTDDAWLLPLDGAATAVPLLNSRLNEGHPQVSPNGKWVTYQSNEAGRVEVYLAPFPSGDGRWQVSTNGGTFARWRADGKEIIYLTSASAGDLMAVTVNDLGSAPELGAPQRLFASGYINVGHSGGNWHTYAVSPDGQRFLIPRPVSSLNGEAPSTPITVVLNWTELLEQDRR
jgi:Tol biopolymer transport system component